MSIDENGRNFREPAKPATSLSGLCYCICFFPTELYPSRGSQRSTSRHLTTIDRCKIHHGLGRSHARDGTCTDVHVPEALSTTAQQVVGVSPHIHRATGASGRRAVLSSDHPHRHSDSETCLRDVRTVDFGRISMPWRQRSRHGLQRGAPKSGEIPSSMRCMKLEGDGLACRRKRLVGRFSGPRRIVLFPSTTWPVCRTRPIKLRR